MGLPECVNGNILCVSSVNERSRAGSWVEPFEQGKPTSNPCSIQLPLYRHQKAVINPLPTLVPFNCHSTSYKKLLPFPFWESLPVQATKKLITFPFLRNHPGSTKLSHFENSFRQQKAVIFLCPRIPSGNKKLSFSYVREVLLATKSCHFPMSENSFRQQKAVIFLCLI